MERLGTGPLDSDWSTEATYGADINVCDELDRTPSQCALDQDSEVAQLLSEYCAKPVE
jgi:hypothetical protein